MNGHDQTRYTRAISAITAALGSFPAILFAVAIVLLWACSYPIWEDGDQWLLIINTITTIVTFVMVFVIQNTANRETRATNAKLDEIIVALNETDDRLVGIEQLPDKEIQAEQERVQKRAAPKKVTAKKVVAKKKAVNR